MIPADVAADQLLTLIDQLTPADSGHFFLVQQCVHDEMRGRDTGPVEELRIPFSLTTPL
ncbi:hypothetical protein [Pseudomonas fluorescens]|uniref:hypothetical protein n=1 Tax=Pseudomonas fluorescens TaxID=294 RepID=UPI00223BD6AB|nr:hypothetical protein [Pseudomonas fluorescens]